MPLEKFCKASRNSYLEAFTDNFHAIFEFQNIHLVWLFFSLPMSYDNEFERLLKYSILNLMFLFHFQQCQLTDYILKRLVFLKTAYGAQCFWIVTFDLYSLHNWALCFCNWKYRYFSFKTWHNQLYRPETFAYIYFWLVNIKLVFIKSIISAF